jgi:type I restriction enzyme M protein
MQWAIYKKSGFKAPPGPAANVVLEPGSASPKCWWAEIETLAASDHNLAAGRYKPQTAEVAPQEDPAELVREVLAIERDVTAELEKLLSEMESAR